ncbi:DUF3060 domain-containing protein [Mycobacterium sp. pUA109]|uniref:DUF3060 domain-containing protein n=1 Tax=Mycobacterium sp. pUA109 TaxID=3238982 RepID=UPI00351B434D
MKWKTLGAALAVGAVAIPSLPTSTPTAHAKNGDTHIVGQGIVQTLDCNDSTLLINGSQNVITALGTCWAVTTQGSSNVVIADTVVNDITVYGYDQTVYYHNGDPYIADIGRQLAMTNRIMRVPT